MYDDIKHQFIVPRKTKMSGWRGDSYSPLHSPMQVDQGAKGTWVRWFRQNHNVCIDQTKRRSDEEAIRRRGDQRKRWSDEGAIRRKGKIGKTTMSGSSSRTVHCPCGRVSECTGAETFLQHDAHQAASANPVTRVSNRHAAVKVWYTNLAHCYDCT